MFDDMGDRREERKKLENDNSFKNKRIVEVITMVDFSPFWKLCLSLFFTALLA
eukprot:m.210571 g.210571  ORF g.210571 m.210571 type:complete len:53 (+) comp39745_c0_seq107:1155-1313(+)